MEKRMGLLKLEDVEDLIVVGFCFCFFSDWCFFDNSF